MPHVICTSNPNQKAHYFNPRAIDEKHGKKKVKIPRTASWRAGEEPIDPINLGSLKMKPAYMLCGPARVCPPPKKQAAHGPGAYSVNGGAKMRLHFLLLACCQANEFVKGLQKIWWKWASSWTRMYLAFIWLMEKLRVVESMRYASPTEKKIHIIKILHTWRLTRKLTTTHVNECHYYNHRRLNVNFHSRDWFHVLYVICPKDIT